MKELFRFKKLRFNWQLGLFLILLFGIPRFLIVLEANRTANYNFTSLLFIIMWLSPFILLKRAGRRCIGIQRPENIRWLWYSLGLGVLACVFIFYLAKYCYQDTIQNFFVYISRSYGAIPQGLLHGEGYHFYFILFALIGMTFSPIGEELLYRGLIHESFVRKFGRNRASAIDSLAFAIVHLAHFGIVYVGSNLKIFWIPGLLWMLLMFMVSRLFFYCKIKAGSIYGPIICHAGFNLAMTYFIMYHIL